MNVKIKSRLVVFVLSVLVWCALVDVSHIQEVIVGIIVAIFVSLFAGRFLIQEKGVKNIPKRFIKAIVYLFKFIWEMIKANFHVAYIVIHPLCPINPGIVKVRTDLKKDFSLTLLANSITLTPGTLTVDINDEKSELYIHCITVPSTSVDENSKAIVGKFEGLLKEVFE
ncbi:MAG: Na+/H+ antiporter subunit E [Ignavibacteriales bacterium]|nr:Na+/H+ antiporter subunit E [Ignavibacteriales bacterium]